MLLKLSSFALVLRPLPPALPTFASLMLCYTPFHDVVVHLGHLLCHHLSDSNDIPSKVRDLIRKANLMLYTSSAADPVVKSICCSLTVCHCMVLLSCSAIHLIEVSFNNILRRIWHLPRNSTPEFYTLLPACPVCLMLSFLGQHPFCHLSSCVLL